jgi:hypothetical protein
MLRRYFHKFSAGPRMTIINPSEVNTRFTNYPAKSGSQDGTLWKFISKQFYEHTLDLTKMNYY